MSYAFDAAELAVATEGKLLVTGPPWLSWALATDSRFLEAGQAFVALHGERFDGHDFVEAALKLPEVGVIGEANKLAAMDQALFQGARVIIAVDDTTLALGRAARWVRGRMELPVVAVTGSAGKTTTRELIRVIMADALGEILAPQGNFNNHIGVPLTLLKLSKAHRGAVIEMGMSNAGEIAYLAGLAQPQVRLITNVGRAHLDTLGDEDGVARAKGELFATARPGDRLIVNLDDKRVAGLPRPAGTELITFGRHPEAIVRLIDDAEAASGPFRIAWGAEELGVEIPLPGAHNRMNAAAALAVAVALDIPLRRAAEALSEAEVEPMRMQLTRLKGGTLIINDAYNANPQSMAAALQTASGLTQPGGGLIAALGDMLELGPLAHESHVELGRRVAEAGVAALFVAGAHAEAVAAGARAGGMKDEQLTVAEGCEALIGGISATLRPNDTLLIKGSRGMKMERVAKALQRQEER